MNVPGPRALGRSVIVAGDDPVPPPWDDADEVVIDEALLATEPRIGPAPETVERLHRAWAAREPVVIRLHVDPGRFRAPVGEAVEPWTLDPSGEPWADRLHFLVWANSYDARTVELIWWWGRKAAKLGATEVPDGPADVKLPDGRPAWIDGGPRQPWPAGIVGGHAVVPSEVVERGELATDPPPRDPTADLAPDQLAAVAHGAGPARVIAPAGSGKTRVLTERLRHLLGDRAYTPTAVLAVAYNKGAQLELESRTAEFRPRVRTLNSLGLWVLAQHRGASPPLVDEREVRRLVDKLAPVRRQRRANTDPIGPYVEALAQVRLGLRDPEDVEAERDDVPGLAELFPRFRQALADEDAVDFDDQVYGAIETLLADGPFRRAMQQRCRHLLVDEFQDLTPAHLLLIRLLALPALDVFGVGDDDQVIYGHASADPAFLIDYARRFPGAADHALTVNYRCPVEVVDRARTLLEYNHRRVAKEIHAGPSADPAPGSLTVAEHGSEAGARAVVDQLQAWLGDPGVSPADIAVLTRVNSLLLAPHIALHMARIPTQSVLRVEVLERTGLRAALAYLRIAASPNAMAPGDIVEILRRPTRGLPQWFPDRLRKRRAWNTGALSALGDTLGDKDARKVDRLVDDLEIVGAAARCGTTRDVLLAVRDDVGLGSAMTLLDRTAGGQGSSHLDDLEGLLQVADLHPDIEGFESWLRETFQREADPAGVTLSTIHRVKGKEWDRVAVFGVSAGIIPHRLADDIEEERRVLHVAITRARHRATLLVDAARPSPFLAELAGTAPNRPPRPADRSGGSSGRETVTPRPKASAKAGATTSRGRAGAGASDGAADGIEAVEGLELTVLDGYDGTVVGIDGHGVQMQVDRGGSLVVRFGERIRAGERTGRLVPPAELWGGAAKVEAALRAWRTTRSKADKVPAYVVLSDKHLRGIALARPSTPEELIACDGIGPTKLENYGDEILEVLDGL